MSTVPNCFGAPKHFSEWLGPACVVLWQARRPMLGLGVLWSSASFTTLLQSPSVEFLTGSTGSFFGAAVGFKHKIIAMVGRNR